MYAKVMVPLDGSKLAECVLPHVRALAQAGQVKNIVLVRAVEPIQAPSGGDFIMSAEDAKKLMREHREAAEDYLKKLTKRLQLKGVQVEGKVLVGRVAEELANYAEKKKMSLLVMATHGRSGVSKWMWGSVADRVLRSTCVPTLMIRPRECKPSG